MNLGTVWGQKVRKTAKAWLNGTAQMIEKRSGQKVPGKGTAKSEKRFCDENGCKGCKGQKRVTAKRCKCAQNEHAHEYIYLYTRKIRYARIYYTHNKITFA